MATRMPSLPAGFRFHPTDEELIVHYLMNQAAAVPCPVPIITEVNIYQCDPWDLPPKALFGETEWYFFSPRDRKYPNGTRPNRAAGSGYWKATGTDKAIVSAPTSENIGVKKALVFYRGKPPKGVKTDWIMHEYRLTVANNKSTRRRGSSSSMRLDDWVLCRIYKKSNNFQYFSDLQDQDGSSTVEEPDSSLNNNSMTMNNGGAPSPKSEEAAHANGDGQQQFHDPGHLTTSMTKSCSLTDLLNTIDYSTLSQLLLDAPPAETDHRTQLQQSPLIYTTPAWQQPHNNYNNYSCNMNNTATSVNMAQDYGASYNGLKRKRVMTTDGAAGSFDDGGSSLKRKLQLPSDSRTGSGFFFGSSSGGSYCNQQLAEAASTGGFQYSGLLSHPFLNQ